MQAVIQRFSTVSVTYSNLVTHTQVLQVSFEAPPGVKRNLQRTYDAWGSSRFSQASPLQAQLLFMLAWFHAIVQERRAYMPQASFTAPITLAPVVQPCISALEPTCCSRLSIFLLWQQQAAEIAPLCKHHAEGRTVCHQQVIQVHCMHVCIDWPQELPWLVSQTAAYWHSSADGILCAVLAANANGQERHLLRLLTFRRQGKFAQTCRAGQAFMTSISVTSEAVQMLWLLVVGIVSLTGTS